MTRRIILSTLALAACGGEPRQEQPPPSAAAQVAPEVTLAQTVAEGIQAAPSRADSVLQAHSITRAGFDSLLYKIAADSALSAQYAAGRR